ncbi:RNA polymerase sigma factor FliA [Marinicellulosiphila megalodicopiae]|uniref:RNA polymerase sigma factor FliA n=1 Tax=Marinicellulosiphila megalodicopiae TaxID=2724896 RepID=UPI003BB0CF4C
MYQVQKSVLNNQLLEEHAVLVKRIAYHLLAKMPDSVQVDDLIQSGMIGLIEASKNYDSTKGASFETYAGIRIRGSMIDEVRRGDWIPRSVHRNGRKIAQAIRDVEAMTGRDAKDHEVAEQLEISIEQYNALLQDSQSARLFSFEDILSEQDGPGELMIEGHQDGPFEGLSDNLRHQSIVSAMQGLPQREQLVLSLYYNEELNLKEIGEVLSVSESRVSQLHSQAACRLRSRLQQWNDNA